jgi:ketosteroid isomerase-like protein
MDTRESSGFALASRLREAVNRHDLDAMAGCFAPEFMNETPAHPARSFRGRDQVRKNWAQIFAAVPNLEADLVDCASNGTTIWTEWEMRGRRVDGAHHLMRGVSIFEVVGDTFASVRFYLEPVDQDSGSVDTAVHSVLTR